MSVLQIQVWNSCSSHPFCIPRMAVDLDASNPSLESMLFAPRRLLYCNWPPEIGEEAKILRSYTSTLQDSVIGTIHLTPIRSCEHPSAQQ